VLEPTSLSKTPFGFSTCVARQRKGRVLTPITFHWQNATEESGRSGRESLDSLTRSSPSDRVTNDAQSTSRFRFECRGDSLCCTAPPTSFSATTKPIDNESAVDLDP
jgi:hypothetical protein